MKAYPVRLVLLGTMAMSPLLAVAADGNGHMVSPALAAEIAASLPKFDPAKKLQDASLAAVQAPQAIPDPLGLDIVRLPEYVVRESRPLDQGQRQLIEGRANIAMRLYLGDTNSLDRGVLNRFTFPELWGKIPVLGALPCPLGMTNQARAMQRYEEDERLSLKSDLLLLESLGEHAKDGATKSIEREIKDTLKVSQE